MARAPLLPAAVAVDDLSFEDAEAMFDRFWRLRDAFPADRRMLDPRAESETEELLEYVSWRLTDIGNSLERRKPRTNDEREIRARVLVRWGIECGEDLHILAPLLALTAEFEDDEPADDSGARPIRGVAVVDRIDAVHRKAILLGLAATGSEGESDARAPAVRDAMFEAIDELGDMLGQLSADVSLGLQQPGGADAEG